MVFLRYGGRFSFRPMLNIFLKNDFLLFLLCCIKLGKIFFSRNVLCIMDGNQLIGYRTVSHYGACAEILIFVVRANVL